MTKMAFSYMFPSSFFIISDFEVYEHHTVYKVYYHTAHNAGTFATEHMFLSLHWQVTDLEEIRSINDVSYFN